jgi:hypothetical protein
MIHVIHIGCDGGAARDPHDWAGGKTACPDHPVFLRRRFSVAYSSHLAHLGFILKRFQLSIIV